MSEVRGSGLECQAVMAQERPRGATLRPRGATALPRSVVAAGRSYPMSEVRGCILSPCLFNLYAEYIMRNARLDEAYAGIKIAGRNINNLSYADDTTPMAESEELKSLLMIVKEESEKFGLKLNIQKTKIMASSPITSWQMDGETMETVADSILGAPKSLQIVIAAMKLKDAYSLEEKL